MKNQVLMDADEMIERMKGTKGETAEEGIRSARNDPAGEGAPRGEHPYHGDRVGEGGSKAAGLLPRPQAIKPEQTASLAYRKPSTMFRLQDDPRLFNDLKSILSISS
jgi:hypothetical protein